MKLEAAAGLRHLCTKDTPSLNISFPYAKAGRTRSSLLTCFYSLHAPTPSEWFCAVKEKCSEGRGPLGLDLSGSTWFSWQRQNGGKSPAWWVGWATHTHTDIHVSETHYIHLHNHDSMNCHLFITDKKKKKKVYSCFNILAVLICNIWSFFLKVGCGMRNMQPFGCSMLKGADFQALSNICTPKKYIFHSWKTLSKQSCCAFNFGY